MFSRISALWSSRAGKARLMERRLLGRGHIHSNAVCAPIRAETGITSVLCSKDSPMVIPRTRSPPGRRWKLVRWKPRGAV